MSEQQRSEIVPPGLVRSPTRSARARRRPGAGALFGRGADSPWDRRMVPFEFGTSTLMTRIQGSHFVLSTATACAVVDAPQTNRPIVSPRGE